jgi:cytochrome c oxidase cbb3-type subunit I/II
MEQKAEKEARAQAEEIAKDLPENKTMPVDANKEIIALIAYLQRLGKDIKAVGAH